MMQWMIDSSKMRSQTWTCLHSWECSVMNKKYTPFSNAMEFRRKLQWSCKIFTYRLMLIASANKSEETSPSINQLQSKFDSKWIKHSYSSVLSVSFFFFLKHLKMNKCSVVVVVALVLAIVNSSVANSLDSQNCNDYPDRVSAHEYSTHLETISKRCRNNNNFGSGDIKVLNVKTVPKDKLYCCILSKQINGGTASCFTKWSESGHSSSCSCSFKATHWRTKNENAQSQARVIEHRVYDDRLTLVALQSVSIIPTNHFYC